MNYFENRKICTSLNWMISSCSIFLFSLIVPTATHAASPNNSIEEIIIIGSQETDDPTVIAADASALLSIAGDINDPLKAILVLPSITFGGGDFEDPVIRGAGPNDNFYLLDGMPLPLVYHDLSDSILSDLVIRSFDLYAGSAPARFGGRIGGVVEMSLRDPATKDLSGVVDLGLIKSGFMVEGPLTDNTSAYLSFREGLAHVFLTRFEESDETTTAKLPTSRDYTARLKWRGDNKNVTLTSIGSFDQSLIDQLDDIDFPSGTFDELDERSFVGNSITYDKTFNDKHSFSITASKVNSQNKYSFGKEYSEDLQRDRNSLRLNHEMVLEPVTINAGVNYLSDDVSFDNTATSFKFKLETFEAYIEADAPINDKIHLTGGFSAAKDTYFDESSIDPRLKLDYKLSEQSSVFINAGKSRQHPTFFNPNSKDQQFSEKVTQLGVGYRKDFDNSWAMQTELFYKSIEDTSLVIDGQLQTMDGSSPGIDLMVSKKSPNGLNGFFALSLIDSTRTLNNKTFDYEYSFPVSLTLALNKTLDSGWSFGTKYRYQTGNAYTPATGVNTDPFSNTSSLIYGDPFSERGEDYHRVDIRVEKDLDWSFAESSVYMDVLNVFNNNNRTAATPFRTTISSDGTIQPFPASDRNVPLVAAIGFRLRF